MKEMFQVQNDHWRIESEPGDATHYSYRVHIDRTDPTNPKYNFEAVNSTFRYPEFIFEKQVLLIISSDNGKEFTDEEIVIAKLFDCNPWTVRECRRTVQDIVNELA